MPVQCQGFNFMVVFLLLYFFHTTTFYYYYTIYFTIVYKSLYLLRMIYYFYVPTVYPGSNGNNSTPSLLAPLHLVSQLGPNIVDGASRHTCHTVSSVLHSVPALSTYFSSPCSVWSCTEHPHHQFAKM